MLPVSSKEVAENLEFILMERYKWQITNCDHGKCSMEETHLPNSINACAIGAILARMVFDARPIAETKFFVFTIIFNIVFL
uniref:DSPn domain-containing protein n=1 Tax=Rhabditophanes sp. KR3021 TaxID=114890 RepID=A0AC35U2H1_9BILA